MNLKVQKNDNSTFYSLCHIPNLRYLLSCAFAASKRELTESIPGYSGSIERMSFSLDFPSKSVQKIRL